MAQKHKDIKRHIVEEITEEISCDICQRQILKDKKDEDLVEYATLTKMAVETNGLKTGYITEETLYAKEQTDLCAVCYDVILTFVKETFSAKIPSYYMNSLALSDQVQKLFDDVEELPEDFDA